MKKIVLLVMAVVSYHSVFAVVSQVGWRWRNDDGSETSATWKAPAQTSFILSSTSEKFRLRFEIANEEPEASRSLTNDTLQYSTSTTGPWIPILPDAGSSAFMLAGTAAVVDLEATTEQLANTKGYTFRSGFVIVSSVVFTDDLTAQTTTEYEWVIKGTPNTLPNTIYYFRGSQGGDPELGYPTLTTASVLPISLASFTAQSLGQTVKLQWTTATEQNNDRFEILRSADGRTNWQVIGTVKGNGTTTKSTTYTYTDNNPLNGTNYYRLKQYDFDGKFKESDIRSLMMQLTKALLNVFPNPSKGAINFTLNEFKGGNLTVILSDMNGKLVHREIIAANANNSYKLNLKNTPAPGIYMLQVKGDGFEKSVQVVIQ